MYDSTARAVPVSAAPPTAVPHDNLVALSAAFPTAGWWPSSTPERPFPGMGPAWRLSRPGVIRDGGTAGREAKASGWWQARPPGSGFAPTTPASSEFAPSWRLIRARARPTFELALSSRIPRGTRQVCRAHDRLVALSLARTGRGNQTGCGAGPRLGPARLESGRRARARRSCPCGRRGRSIVSTPLALVIRVGGRDEHRLAWEAAFLGPCG